MAGAAIGSTWASLSWETTAWEEGSWADISATTEGIMAITQSMCTSFKVELFSGIHDLTTDTIKIALYDSMADLGPETTTYVASNESVAPGYTAGGHALTPATPAADGYTAIADFADLTIASTTLQARGGLIYNVSKGDRAIMVLDFGATRAAVATGFKIKFPVADADSAIMRIR